MEVTGHLHAPVALSALPTGNEHQVSMGPRFGLIAVEKRKIESIPCACRQSIPDFLAVQPFTQFLTNRAIPASLNIKLLGKYVHLRRMK
jgi:hypothetical protein